MLSAENAQPKDSEQTLQYVVRLPRFTCAWVCICHLPCGSLSFETAVIVSFAGLHGSGKVCVECSANFFELDLVDFHVLLRQNSNRFHALENTNQTVRVAVPQKNFGIPICLHCS